MLYEIFSFLNDIANVLQGHSTVVIMGLVLLCAMWLLSMFGTHEQVSKAHMHRQKPLTGLLDKFDLR